MASYRQLSRVARLVDGLLDLNDLSDAEIDRLLECADDEEELRKAAAGMAARRPRRALGETAEPEIGGESPRLISDILRQSFRVLRGGRP